MTAMPAKRAVLAARTARLLDANLNRAREGIRVVEDAARFLLNDKAGYRRLRALRHRLDAVTRPRYRELVAARESRKDIGRRIKEAPTRPSLAAVVAANLRRAEEATRVLEEYARLFSPEAVAAFKSVRYGLYQEEKRILKILE